MFLCRLNGIIFGSNNGFNAFFADFFKILFKPFLYSLQHKNYQHLLVCAVASIVPNAKYINCSCGAVIMRFSFAEAP
jgi:hypothetical protein